MIVCSFSGIYENEGCIFDAAEEILDFKELQGTNGYCCDDAACEIRSKIKERTQKGVHLLDNGSFHYMSKLWMEKIKEPFDLIVFDNHTDMQPPGLLPILSCGSWIRDSINDENVKIDKAYLIGPKQEDYDNVEEELKSKVIYVPQDRAENPKEELAKMIFDKPVYISVDKDVLSETELKTNWDQGIMSADTLAEWLKGISEKAKILGMDICGEPGPEELTEKNIRRSQAVNIRLKNILERKLKIPCTDEG